MSSHTLSPIKPNGELTQTAKFTLQDGTEVKMVVDIDLNGNTGEPTFSMQRPVTTLPVTPFMEPVFFPESLDKIFAEVISNAGLKQFPIA